MAAASFGTRKIDDLLSALGRMLSLATTGMPESWPIGADSCATYPVDD
jgi:hypothetical protein